MYVDKQNVVGTWCWFGRQKWSHFRSQQIRHNRKIRKEEELINGSMMDKRRLIQEIFRK